MIEVATHRLRCAGILFVGSLLISPVFAANTQSLWKDLPDQRNVHIQTEKDQPTQLRTVTLEFAELKSTLAATKNQAKNEMPLTLALPKPEGGFAEFALVDSGTLPAQLIQRYPKIRSFKGSDNEGRYVRLDISPQGMKAMVFDPKGSWLVQPAETFRGEVKLAKASGDQYWSFYRAKLPLESQSFKEEIIDPAALQMTSGATKRAITGNMRRDYRIALAATSKYTAKFGGTVAGGLAAITVMLNRINEIFEKDLGVHLTLIADNDKIIYTNRATDPYRNADLLEMNVINLDKVLGQASFDIGHVVTTGSGGVVGKIGNVCIDAVDSTNKAAGMTGRDNPVGDPFYIDFVAHEMGHQFGAWHSYSSCNQDTSTLVSSMVEPGSGSTIMGYADLCLDSENLQKNSDPYFHATSIEQIQAWISSKGGSCAVKQINTKDAPWIDPESMPGEGFNVLSIPAKTPFALQGNASSNGSGSGNGVMSYAWEQIDSSPGNIILTDDGKGAIFRSYLPSTSGERVFPRMAAVLGDVPLGNGEVYPATNRQLVFRLTARDNHATEPATSSADVTINVVNTGRAFAVIKPNQNVTFTRGSSQTITWDVANTDRAPISCGQVQIRLSVDGGYSYLTKPVAGSLPNIGSASITIPKLPNATTQARLKVSCLDNVFFAVSPVNFAIQ